MVFICMLVFQLAGALLLLLNSIKGSKRAIIKNCFSGSNTVDRDDNDNCTIQQEKLQKSAHKSYLNISAFGDLVIGYVIAVANPTPNYSSLDSGLGVALLTGLLLFLEYSLSREIAEWIYSEDMVVPYSELEKNDVETTVTEKEIDEMFKEGF